MIGTCPHCGINLKEPPSNNRETNEVMIVLTYRKLIETLKHLDPLEVLGKCIVCNATLDDIEKQKSLLKLKVSN